MSEKDIPADRMAKYLGFKKSNIQIIQRLTNAPWTSNFSIHNDLKISFIKEENIQ